MNHVVYRSREGLSHRQHQIAQALAGSSFGKSEVPRECMTSITESLIHCFAQIDLHPTACSDGVKYFNVLEVSELAGHYPKLD